MSGSIKIFRDISRIGDKMIEGNYVILSRTPATPLNKIPTRHECKSYEFMTMAQLCNIAESNGIGRSKACNAFGGDKGKHKVIIERMARTDGIRKYVLVSAVFDYFEELGINW